MALFRSITSRLVPSTQVRTVAEALRSAGRPLRWAQIKTVSLAGILVGGLPLVLRADGPEGCAGH